MKPTEQADHWEHLASVIEERLRLEADYQGDAAALFQTVAPALRQAAQALRAILLTPEDCTRLAVLLDAVRRQQDETLNAMEVRAFVAPYLALAALTDSGAWSRLKSQDTAVRCLPYQLGARPVWIVSAGLYGSVSGRTAERFKLVPADADPDERLTHPIGPETFPTADAAREYARVAGLLVRSDD